MVQQLPSVHRRLGKPHPMTKWGDVPSVPPPPVQAASEARTGKRHPRPRGLLRKTNLSTFPWPYVAGNSAYWDRGLGSPDPSKITLLIPRRSRLI